MKRLSIFLDGTWNDEGSHTNVHELAQRVAPAGSDGVQQAKPYYDPGVGTKRFEKVRGGAVGLGLSKNVQDAYSWLLDHYEDGDEVYIFGFSRGAYTARSLGGLIAGCGLARRNAPFDVSYLYERYQKRKGEAAPIFELAFLRDGPNPKRALTAEENRLLDHSRRIQIRMMGVWDTVGALGVPWTGFPLIGRDKYYFHNPNLSRIYDNAFQALAIDEHRGAYKPTLWTLFVPDPQSGQAPTPPVMPSREHVEQRWFIGAHADVGGGYKDDPLALPPCAWLQSKAQGLGLNFTQRIALSGKEHEAAPHDSYAKFLFHLYRIGTLNRRFYRPIGIEKNKVKGGWSYPVNEVIDGSIFERYRFTNHYRPKNLEEWAKKRGKDLVTLFGEQS